MNPRTAWKQEFDHEIEQAERALSRGNEGMARVCARRAAGIVIGEYLFRHGYSGTTHSVYERLALLDHMPEVNQEYKDIASHFLLKVNHEHQFMHHVDLIEDARILEKSLLTNNN